MREATELQQIEIDEKDLKDVDFNATALNLVVKGSNAKGLQLSEDDLATLHRTLHTAIVIVSNSQRIPPGAFSSDALHFLAAWAEAGMKWLQRQKCQA